MQQKHYFLKTCLFIGFAFFYIPILSMIFFSFNKSRLATVWGGFSTEWYHLDPWWNPAVEDQASDRAHRLGQRRPVTIYRLVALGTIEEKMLSLHAEKRSLVAQVLGGKDTAGKLSTQELVGLLSAQLRGPDGGEGEDGGLSDSRSPSRVAGDFG